MKDHNTNLERYHQKKPCTLGSAAKRVVIAAAVMLAGPLNLVTRAAPPVAEKIAPQAMAPDSSLRAQISLNGT